MHNMTEEWRDVKGAEGEYEVSNKGQVRSVTRKIKQKNRWGTTSMAFVRGGILRGRPDKNGYLEVCIHGKNAKIHRLVADAFIPHKKCQTIVNHKNGVKDDNRAENLEWATVQKNAWHARFVLKSLCGGKRRAVEQLDMNDRYVRRYDSLADAARAIGCTSTTICDCCKGKRKSYGGYQWRYADE